MSAVERFTGNASAIPGPSSGAAVAGRRMASSDERSGSARFGRVLTAARAETNALPAGRPTLAPLDDRLDPSGLIRDRSRQPHRPLAQKRTDPTIGNEADEEESGT